MYPKLHERIGEFQKRFAKRNEAPVSDQHNQEQVQVTYLLSEIVSIIYQPRFHGLVKSHVRKSSSKCSRLFSETSELCGEAFVTKCTQNLTRVTGLPNNGSNNNNLYATAAKQTADENQKKSSSPLATDNIEVTTDELQEKVELSLDCSVGRLSLTTKWRPRKVKNVNILENICLKTVNGKERSGISHKSLRGVHKSNLVKKRKIRGVYFATIFL